MSQNTLKILSEAYKISFIQNISRIDRKFKGQEEAGALAETRVDLFLSVQYHANPQHHEANRLQFSCSTIDRQIPDVETSQLTAT